MKILANQGVTAPKGFLAGGAPAGIKAGGKPDIALLFSEQPASVAAFFTKNKVVAAPVVAAKANLGPTAQAVVINSGNANACTGHQGLIDARKMIALGAERLNIDPNLVLVASTGVIGRPLPMDKIAAGISSLRVGSGPEADALFSQAIMTTDAFPKQVAVQVDLSGGPVRIGGSAKGAGMIAPDMAHATMIAVITTDAPINQRDLRKKMSTVVEHSFNAVTVDGDTSTNDAVFALANWQAGNFKMTEGDKKRFLEALDYVCLQLAKMIVRDGEGATKVITYKVVGAATLTEAKKVAKTIADSLLVKTAFFGRDPNWGRILAAAGRAGVELSLEDLDLDINGVAVVRSGNPVQVDPAKLTAQMEADEIGVWLNINKGSCQAIAYGSDLSYEYVKINAEYTT